MRTIDEQKAIDKLVLEYSVDKEIMAYYNTGEGCNWESFTVYSKENRIEDMIFEDSTRLSDNKDDAIWEGVQHWTALLSKIRCVILGAQWHVHVDDHVLEWDGNYLEYDLSK